MTMIGILLGNICKDATAYHEMLQYKSYLILSSLWCVSRHLQVAFTGIVVIQCSVFQVGSIAMQEGWKKTKKGFVR